MENDETASIAKMDFNYNFRFNPDDHENNADSLKYKNPTLFAMCQSANFYFSELANWAEKNSENSNEAIKKIFQWQLEVQNFLQQQNGAENFAAKFRKLIEKQIGKTPIFGKIIIGVLSATEKILQIESGQKLKNGTENAAIFEKIFGEKINWENKNDPFSIENETDSDKKAAKENFAELLKLIGKITKNSENEN